MVCKEERSKTVEKFEKRLKALQALGEKEGKREIEFAKVFERVAVKYAEYVEAKLVSFAKIKEIKPGQEVVFRESEKDAEQLMLEMQTLTRIVEALSKIEPSLS